MTKVCVFSKKPEHPKFLDLHGLSFGRLKVLGFAGVEKKRTFWYCECDCGNVAKIRGEKLKCGETKSCGCLHAINTKKHGMSKSKTYRIWINMLDRCRNKNNHAFENYGGRGITVCERWLNFENFLADMGERPEGLSLDRKNNNKGYCPENCRWATPKEQCDNKRDNRMIEYGGEIHNVTTWAEILNIERHVIFQRLNKGWEASRILTEPVRSRRNKFSK